MGWQKGVPRGGRAPTAGRRKGTPNKRTALSKSIREAFSLDIPRRIEELLPMLTPKEECDVLVKLLPFFYATKKAVEVDAKVDIGLVERIKELEALPDIELIKLVGNE